MPATDASFTVIFSLNQFLQNYMYFSESTVTLTNWTAFALFNQSFRVSGAQKINHVALEISK